MKRTKISTASNAKPRRNGAAKEKLSHIQLDYSGPSFSDLSNNILVTILLNLPVKRIFVCKCVCKTWYHLISDPDFAKLHFNQAQFYPLLRTPDYTKLSCMLYLVQPEQIDFERKLDMCYDCKSPIKIKLNSNFKLPLRNIEMIPKNICKELNMRNHNYKIVNSCNGLLCLSNPSDNEPVIVCNPITSEFINLPVVRTVHENINRRSVECGFGFSPVTNQYKVVRMFARSTRLLSKDVEVIVVEVHVLGTETWRTVHSSPKSKYVILPTYLNGCVYWFSNGNPHSVISFDIEKECFESISVPTELEYFYTVDKNSMGVLDGELFVSASGIAEIRVWTMKDIGAEKSWTQIFDLPDEDDDDNDDETWPYGSYELIKGLNNGSLLMFNSDDNALIWKDPRKAGFRYLKVRGFRTAVEAIAHIPSFVPLKHALSGHNVEVLKVESRWADLKLHKEGKGISIVEEDKHY